MPEGASMREYRLYTMDGVGRICAAHQFRATGDAEAIMVATAAQKRVKCEVWERDRLVAQIPAYSGWSGKPQC